MGRDEVYFAGRCGRERLFYILQRDCLSCVTSDLTEAMVLGSSSSGVFHLRQSMAGRIQNHSAGF